MRRWYGVQPFPHRQVARDALLAGNDLLLLADFATEPEDSAFQNIVDTVQFFTEGYTTDPVFAARVDDALHRILRHKLRLYGDAPQLETVITPANSLDEVGQQSGQLFEVARNAVTLISPSQEQLAPPPQVGESIVIFTDDRQQRQCDYCSDGPR
jgi:beta-glucosidase-like glycosyl hydrolase